MAGPYLKEWRKHRDLTQEQVVDRLAAMDDPLIPQTSASLSRLENGKQPYTQRSLEALAEVYQCDPGELFELPPREPVAIPADAENVVNIWDTLTKRQQRQALAVIDAIRRESA
jgi:transcriptional regulator with XRE-family HTH domain